MTLKSKEKSKKTKKQLDGKKEDINRPVPKEDTEMANGHMKRCSILLIIREMPVRTAFTGETTISRC